MTTDTPPKPKRRRWLWPVAGVAVLLATAAAMRFLAWRDEQRRLGLISDVRGCGGLALICAVNKEPLSKFPYLRSLSWKHGVAVYIPSPSVAGAVLPMLNSDVWYVDVSPDIFDQLAPRLGSRIPHAALQQLEWTPEMKRISITE